MSQVRDVMTPDVRTVSPGDTIQRVARCMDELNVGAIPVFDGGELIGRVTDRDIAIRDEMCES
jgi:CBS domain-containing protein